MQEKFITLQNSIRLYIRDSETDKTPVLLLHFGSGNSYIWDGIINIFNRSYRIIAPDLRGHGKSDKPETGYHIDDMAHDIYLLLKELEIKKCHIIGSSLGAEVGISFAAAHPEMVLTLVCEGALYNEFGEYGLFKGTKEEIEREKEKRVVARLKRTQPVYNCREELFEKEKKSFQESGLWNKYFQSYVENNICKIKEGKYTSCYPLYVSNEYFKEYLDFRFEKYYQKIDCPVLFMPSTEEWQDSRIREFVYKFGSFLEDYKIELIEGSQHAYVWMQFPQIAGKIAYNFVTGEGYNEKD